MLAIRSGLNENLGSASKCQSQYPDVDTTIKKATDSLCQLYCPCAATSSYVQTNICVNSSYYCVEGGKNILECNPCQEIQYVNETIYNEMVI